MHGPTGSPGVWMNFRTGPRGARLPWRGYRDLVGKEALEFLGYEASASILRQYQNAVVPGLLQTPEYTRALLKGAYGTSPQQIGKLLDLREQRQRHAWLGSTELHFVLDEAVLRRRVGSAEVMRGQLCHLGELAERGATVQILQFNSGASFAVHGPFTLVHFEDEVDGGVVFLEHALDSRVIKDAEGVTTFYRQGFEDLGERAAPPSRTARLVATALDSHKGG